MIDKKEVKRFLNEIGVPYGLKGRTYIEDAIEIIAKDHNAAIVKEVYEAIANNRNTTTVRVERAIRHAVELTFINGNIEAQNEFFGYTYDVNKGKMNNKAFLHACVDVLENIE